MIIISSIIIIPWIGSNAASLESSSPPPEVPVERAAFQAEGEQESRQERIVLFVPSKQWLVFTGPLGARQADRSSPPVCPNLPPGWQLASDAPSTTAPERKAGEQKSDVGLFLKGSTFWSIVRLLLASPASAQCQPMSSAWRQSYATLRGQTGSLAEPGVLVWGVP